MNTETVSTDQKGNDVNHVLASGGSNFLLIACDNLIYKTPKKIVDFIEKEKLKVLIGNPPFST